MPITEERQTIQDLRAAGFSEEQALLLAGKFEATAQATSQDLKGFMVAENDKRFGAMAAEMDRRFSAMTAEMDRRFAEMERRFDAQAGEMDSRFAQMEARFERSLRLQLGVILSSLVGVVGVAVALIKLFP